MRQSFPHPPFYILNSPLSVLLPLSKPKPISNHLNHENKSLRSNASLKPKRPRRTNRVCSHKQVEDKQLPEKPDKDLKFNVALSLLDD